jgi:chromosome segregation ATPase
MTQSPNQRLDRIEDEFETVKQLLASAARYAESANEKIDRLSERQDRTQVQLDQLGNRQDRTQEQLDRLTITVEELTTAQTQTQTQLRQLSNRVDEFVFQAQRLFTQSAERLIRLEGQTERLEALFQRLDRNHSAQQSQLQEFQKTTTAALDRIDRVLDYLLNQQRGEE